MKKETQGLVRDMKKYVLGVDIGGTKSAAALSPSELPNGGYENFILDKSSFPTRTDLGWEYTVNKLFEQIDALLIRNGVSKSDVAGIGVSCGGPLDHEKGVILNPPNLYGWNEVPITSLLARRYGAEAFLENDANACTLAEWQFGAAKGYSNAIFLTFGTGMGAGLILDGRLYRGANDMAGEIGHVRLERLGPVGYGKSGSFEGFCSGYGIAQLARARVLEALQSGNAPSFCKTIADLDSLTAKSVGEAADCGDPLAISIYRECGSFLGAGLSILIDILNPEIIVIGSIFSRKSKLLWPSAQEAIKREALWRSASVCRVVPCALGERIGDYAALSTALYHI